MPPVLCKASFIECCGDKGQRPVFKTGLMKLQSQKLAKVYMSMWARLGRFLEINGPKF
jgi:hypothetical protein